MYSDQGGQWSPSPPPGPKCALEEPHDAQGVAFKVHLGYHKTKAAGGSHHMLSDDGAIPDDAGIPDSENNYINWNSCSTSTSSNGRGLMHWQAAHGDGWRARGKSLKAQRSRSVSSHSDSVRNDPTESPTSQVMSSSVSLDREESELRCMRSRRSRSHTRRFLHRREEAEWREGRRRLRERSWDPTDRGTGRGDHMERRSPTTRGPCRRGNRGGGMGVRGRGRQPFPSWGRFGGRGRRSPSYSPSVDSEEEYRRSRSRERARRRRQYETIQRYCRPGGSQQVCWDGFQWVKKSNDGDGLFDQHMNATRRARRLHVGNLPLSLDATEEDLKKFLWDALRKRTGKHVGAGACPVLHVWFSKERGSNYGFVEMATVEDAQAALLLSPLFWKGQQLRINRPTEWKKDAAEVNFAEVAGYGGASPTSFTKQGSLPVELLQCQIQTELLHGQPSRVVRITNPVPEAETAEELEETLSDILEEVNKRQDVLAALIITKELEKQLPAAEVGDIYVQFATGIQADKCILSFAGRMYDGHPLVIERFNEMVWRQTMQQHAKSFLTEILSRFM
ncbi:splicing factor U2af large subunit B [Cyclospora cayetanensis]|uniref:Splicing factor U2af large subunit B n=1 Tax=Cyclospora cayetanensis TaxID=88456 RepID=A0A6P6S1S2_9EIME|nr:splicing factor U2af large subunit B [Cyclospora cayetanensis]